MTDRSDTMTEGHPKIPVEAALTVERFAGAFAAELAARGRYALWLDDRDTSRRLHEVVDFLDDVTEGFVQGNADWKAIAPWVELANGLRPSSLGSFRKWAKPLLANEGCTAEGTTMSTAWVVSFSPRATAFHEATDGLTSAQASLVRRAAEAFEAAARPA